MITLKVLAAGALLAVPLGLADAPVARADPLIPPTPAEIEYLDHAHRVLSVTQDPMVEFQSDGELLDKGRYACYFRDTYGLVGQSATIVSPIITQLAFIYLCPQ